MLGLNDVVGFLAGIAELDAVWVEEYSDQWYVDDNDWVLVGKNPAFLNSRRLRTMKTEWSSPEPAPVRWTDDFSNLFEVLDWK